MQQHYCYEINYLIYEERKKTMLSQFLKSFEILSIIVFVSTFCNCFFKAYKEDNINNLFKKNPKLT